MRAKNFSTLNEEAIYAKQQEHDDVDDDEKIKQKFERDHAKS